MEQLLQEGYGYIATSVMRSKDISIRAKTLYCYFVAYAGKDGVAFPSRNMMCFQLNVNNDSLSKYIKELVDNSFITLSQKKFTQTRYYINFDKEVEIEQIEYSANSSLKGIFRQGYGRICKYVMIYKSISMPAKAVYGYLCTFTNPAFPPREQICNDLQITQNSLTKYLLELVQNDIISISKNLNADNTYANNIYTISSDLEQRFKSLVTANSNHQNLVSENLKNSYPKNCNMDNLMDGNLMDGNLLSNNKKNNNNKTNNNRNNNNNILNNNKNSNNTRESEHSLQNFKSILNNYSNNSSLIKTLTNFISFREKMDKPFLTEESVEAFLETLNNFNDDKTKIDCLNYSMTNNYTTIYLDFKNKPIKKNSSKSDNPTEPKANDTYAKFLEDNGLDDNDEAFERFIEEGDW